MVEVQSGSIHMMAQIAIGSVWVFHGLYSKLLGGIPRHRLIVGKILGPTRARVATTCVGVMEVLLGIWAFSGFQPLWCASVQTGAIIVMNTLEIWLAREFLISAAGMVILNAAFLTLAWWWAYAAR